MDVLWDVLSCCVATKGGLEGFSRYIKFVVMIIVRWKSKFGGDDVEGLE